MQRGQPDQARVLLGQALERAELAELRLEAASARFVLGRLTGGDAGLAMADEARAYFELQGLAAERVVALIVPGFPR